MPSIPPNAYWKILQHVQKLGIIAKEGSAACRLGLEMLCLHLLQVKTMESGLYIPKSGSITPCSIQGNALKPPTDVPGTSGEILFAM